MFERIYTYNKQLNNKTYYIMKNYSAFNSNEETSITFEKMGSQRREKRICTL